jgi:hypothetical protein
MSTATQLDVIATITQQTHAHVPFIDDHLERLVQTADRSLGILDLPFLPTKLRWDKPADVSTTNELSYKPFKFAEA